MFFQLLLLLFLAIVARKLLMDFKYRAFDGPSPFLSFPMVGHGYLLGSNPHQKLMEMKEKYGDVFRFDMGGRPTIILCNYQHIKDTFFKESFSGRPWCEVPAFKEGAAKDAKGNPIFGVVSSEGPFYYEQRRFMLKCLTDLGMGKMDTMEAVIEQEAQQLASILKAKKGLPIKSRGMFLTASNNVIWRILSGKRTRQDDPELLDLTNRVVQLFKGLDPTSVFGLLQTNSAIFLRTVDFLGWPNYLSYFRRLWNATAKTVDQSLPDEKGNYIERALDAIEQDSLNNKKTIWTSPDAKIYLKNQISDLFVAGTETTSTSIEWVILYLVKFPEKQEQVFKEIQQITGDNSRPVSMIDRSTAHYCNAFIEEALRFGDKSFLPPPRKTLEDEKLQDKIIPKGTQVMWFLYAVNNDPTYFPEPDVFKPERFLDNEGTYCKNDKHIPFGIGKRRCPGEVLSRAELFLFVTRLIQQFKISAVKQDELSLKGLPGFVFYPKPFDLLAEEREGIQF